MSKMIHAEMIRSGWCASALVLLAAACSGETVDLGEVSRDITSSSSQCQESTLVAGDVLVEDQAQLDALVGCEEIEGNLYVRPFADADFTPLASLTRVGGALDIGRRTAFDSATLTPDLQDQLPDVMAQEDALLAAGCFSSLEGFENLASAGSLALAGVGASNLVSFSNLSALTNGGLLQISDCSAPISLTGLERLQGVVELTVQCNTLESLAGPRFTARMGDIYVSGTILSDLGALAPESVKDLRVEDTALENLDAFSKLSRATSIDIYGNPLLTNANALDALFIVGSLRIASSPLLERVPDLTQLYQLDMLSLLGNDALINVPALPSVAPLPFGGEWGNFAPSDALRVRPDVIEINGNASLESIAIPGGWLAASYIDIGGNDNLTSIDLANIHAVDGLSIFTNPALATVNLGQLETVDDLRIIDNPLLPLGPFDDVQTFRRIVQSGPLTPEQLEQL